MEKSKWILKVSFDVKMEKYQTFEFETFELAKCFLDGIRKLNKYKRVHDAILVNYDKDITFRA
jgi:hypothetical protein